MAVTRGQVPAPVRPWPAPVPGRTPTQARDLYRLRIRLWDLHAARGFARRLQAAGVAAEDIVVKGHRTSDGLVEADVKPLSRMTTRWKVNIVVAIAAAIIVGVPMGSSLASLLLGEHAAVMAGGAVVGGVGLASTGLYGVWGDHFQRFADSRSETRVEGYVTVSGDTSIVRAEMLLTTTDDVIGVDREMGAAPGVPKAEVDAR